MNLKRLSLSSAALAVVFICAAWSWNNKEEKGQKAVAAAPAQSAPAAETSTAKGEETIVHTFATDDLLV
jgi:hypothetical protein